MASLIDKLTNVLMPEEEMEEKQIIREKKVVNGNMHNYERPTLTVHTNIIPELKVMVYEPISFDQANIIANALKNKEAVIVNYEKVDPAEQRRLCDFINGVCYVLDGGVQRVSETNVLYVPSSVGISKELCSYSMPAYVKHQV